MSSLAQMLRVVLVTFPSQDLAQSISRKVVEKHLAACANIIPKVLSIYFWDEKINEDEEVLTIYKTCAENIPDLIELIKALHPYEVPEIISLPIIEGNEMFLNWVSNETRTKKL